MKEFAMALNAAGLLNDLCKELSNGGDVKPTVELTFRNSLEMSAAYNSLRSSFYAKHHVMETVPELPLKKDPNIITFEISGVLFRFVCTCH